jgi:hypothetical protein
MHNFNLSIIQQLIGGYSYYDRVSLNKKMYWGGGGVKLDHYYNWIHAKQTDQGVNLPESRHSDL